MVKITDHHIFLTTPIVSVDILRQFRSAILLTIKCVMRVCPLPACRSFILKIAFFITSVIFDVNIKGSAYLVEWLIQSFNEVCTTVIILVTIIDKLDIKKFSEIISLDILVCCRYGLMVPILLLLINMYRLRRKGIIMQTNFSLMQRSYHS